MPYHFGMDPQTLLNLINEAIAALLTGGHQSYSIGARSVTKLDLRSLFEERRVLEMEVDRRVNGAARLAKFGRLRT